MSSPPVVVPSRGSDRLTVASVPAGHPYVRRISADSGVELLDDPVIPGAPASTWWPPVILDPEWIRAHCDQAELLHIHFGMESFGPGHLAACVEAAHESGWPVVFTVHDLTNPQLHDQTLHIRQLDEIVTGADALITLTNGAAGEVRTRWGREADVIPHPSLLAPDAEAPAVLATHDLRIGTHLKDLRPNVDGPGTIRTLLDAVQRLRAEGLPAEAEVRIHHQVRDETALAEVRRLCAKGGAALIEHERLSDAELTISLSRLDACVLPYRFGTHSGWLELCWDLGVPVAAPDVGYYAEQHDDGTVASWEAGDATSLAAALSRLVAASSGRPGSLARADLVSARHSIRARADAAIAARHGEIYRRLIAERRS